MSESSEIGEDFAALKKDRQAKKLRNKQDSTDILLTNGLEFDSHNNGVHLVVKHNGNFVDYWPSTGKFIFRGTKVTGRGIFNLLKKLGVKNHG